MSDAIQTSYPLLLPSPAFSLNCSHTTSTFPQLIVGNLSVQYKVDNMQHVQGAPELATVESSGEERGACQKYNLYTLFKLPATIG